MSCINLKKNHHGFTHMRLLTLPSCLGIRPNCITGDYECDVICVHLPRSCNTSLSILPKKHAFYTRTNCENYDKAL